MTTTHQLGLLPAGLCPPVDVAAHLPLGLDALRQPMPPVMEPLHQRPHVLPPLLLLLLLVVPAPPTLGLLPTHTATHT